jgi:hypothetical protein
VAAGEDAPPEDDRDRRFWAGVEATSRFFQGEGPIHDALDKLTRTLEAQGIPYAIVGGMALNEHGYRRMTTDIDVLMNPAGFERFKTVNLGRDYEERRRGVRDRQNGIDIDVILTGDYPGDGKPKPVAFPDPALVAEKRPRMALLPLLRLIEIKLASGMTAPDRLRDLADIQELIRATALPDTIALELDPFVREQYLELWRPVQSVKDE